MDLLPLLGLALLLGLKHSFDADHLVAVSTYLTRARGVRRAAKLGAHWAAGHMLTAAGITFILFTFKDLLLDAYLGGFETAVGVMLILLGLLALRDLRRHIHAHRHGAAVHTHPHARGSHTHDHRSMFGVGIVHGLASNDELLLLLTLSIGISALPELLLGVLLFSAGVLFGMLLFSAAVSYPAGRARGRLRAALVGGSGLLSIAYGSLLLLGLS